MSGLRKNDTPDTLNTLTPRAERVITRSPHHRERSEQPPYHHLRPRAQRVITPPGRSEHECHDTVRNTQQGLTSTSAISGVPPPVPRAAAANAAAPSRSSGGRFRAPRSNGRRGANGSSPPPRLASTARARSPVVQDLGVDATASDQQQGSERRVHGGSPRSTRRRSLPRRFSSTRWSGVSRTRRSATAVANDSSSRMPSTTPPAVRLWRSPSAFTTTGLESVRSRPAPLPCASRLWRPQPASTTAFAPPSIVAGDRCRRRWQRQRPG